MVEFLIQVIFTNFVFIYLSNYRLLLTLKVYVKTVENIDVEVVYSLGVKQGLYYTLTKVNIFLFYFSRCSYKAE